MPTPRTKTGNLFIRCTDEEAEIIRNAAKIERRTVTAYILNVAISRIEAREKALRNEETARNSDPSPR